ncbi:MAG TPA: PfkB family carbohydrate kinase [Candidatus Dormibacteraeota bacterium]
MRPELLVAGSVALDTRDGPFGNVTDELGGSAVYFALAASLILPVRVAAPVGADGLERLTNAFGSRPIDTTYLTVLDAPTYRWRAHQQAGRNVDLGSRDSIYDQWEPVLPQGFDGWAFVGSMRPDRQSQAMERLGGASLLAADAMLSYVHSQPPAALSVLRQAAWYFCNQEEFLALGGRDPQDFRRQWSLAGLVIKAGPDGLSAYTDDGVMRVPSLVDRPVVDTTGAGDAVAGGMLARWLSTGGETSGLQDALMWGVASAALTIADVGVRGIANASREQLEACVREVDACLRRAS